MNSQNKTVLLTGGTQGLGSMLAKELAAQGAKVIVLARRADVATDNAHIEYHQVDVSDYKQVRQLADLLAGTAIDILINNAGVWTTNDLEQQTPSRRAEAVGTNLLGVITVTDSFLPHLLAAAQPQILFVNSVAGTLGFGGEGPQWATYNATKWGVKGYMMSLKTREDLKKIKIGAIYPGGFESNIYENAKDGTEGQYHNQPWMMETKTVSDAVLFILQQPKDANIDELVLTKHY